MLHYIKWISHRKLVSAGLNSERTAAYLTSLPETLIFRHEILIQGYLLRAKVIYKAKQVKLLGHTMLFINLIRTKRKNILYFVPVEFLSDCTQAQNTQLGHSGNDWYSDYWSIDTQILFLHREADASVQMIQIMGQDHDLHTWQHINWTKIELYVLHLSCFYAKNVMLFSPKLWKTKAYKWNQWLLLPSLLTNNDMQQVCDTDGHRKYCRRRGARYRGRKQTRPVSMDCSRRI